MDKYKDKYKPESRFSIPRYNNSLSICIPNLKVLCLPVTEKKNDRKFAKKVTKS